MNPRRRLLLNCFMIIDAVIFCFSFLFSYCYFYQNNIFQFLSSEINTNISDILIFLTLIMGWHVTFRAFRLYNSKRLTRHWHEFGDMLKAITIATFMMIIGEYLFSLNYIDSRFILVFWATSILITGVSRILMRIVLMRLRICGRNLRNMLIVGLNKRSVDFYDKIRMRPDLGYHLIGFLDDKWEELDNIKEDDYPIYNGIDAFADVIRKLVVDEVIIFLPIKSHFHQIQSIVKKCDEQGIIVRYVMDFFNLRVDHVEPGEVDNMTLIGINTGTISGGQLLMKRWLDISISLFAIMVLMPVFTLTAILIKLTSSGPVFFIQERVGYNKRIFRLFKFRTMFENSESIQATYEHLNEVDGPAFKIRNDPRITPMGKFLRKMSIDELPQLYNVLRGDMSLVGPRPLPVRDYQRFNVDWHRRRFSVRPGITCLWQVQGRNSIPFEQWMKLDLQYIDNWSIWLDLKILMKTIPAVILGVGAA